jgi:hypothetical protein
MDLSLHGTLDVALQCASLKKYTAANTAVANDTPAAADEIKLTDATGFLDGNTFGVPIAGLVTAGELQARFIQGNAPSYDVAPAFSRNPIAAETVYGGSTYAMYPHDDGDTATFIGEGNGYRIIATGCRAAPPKITGKVGQRVMLEFTFQITSFVFSANNATYSQLTGAAAAKMLSSAFWWKDTAVASTPAVDVELDYGGKLDAKESFSGADGKIGWILSDSNPKLKVSPFFNIQWQTDFIGSTGGQVALVQLGHVHGEAGCILIPAAQVTKFPAPKEISSSFIGHDIELTPTVEEMPIEIQAGVLFHIFN